MKYRHLITTLFALSLSSLAIAKSINLYDQPKNGKIIGTVDSEAGIMTIYTPPKDKDWVKVADPRNGNVGWVKTTDFNSNMPFTFNVIKSNDGNHTYQIFQYGNMKPYTPTPEQIKAMQTREEAFQRDMQRMMQDMMDFHSWMGPMILPVLVVPEKTVNTPTQKNMNTPEKK